MEFVPESRRLWSTIQQERELMIEQGQDPVNISLEWTFTDQEKDILHRLPRKSRKSKNYTPSQCMLNIDAMFL
jgi:hypothetical protein